MTTKPDDGDLGVSIDIMSSQISSISPSKHKMSVSSPRKKSASLPSETVEYLKSWMMSPEHIAHPYPTEQEKAKIMKDTGIELKQLTNWFVNNRKRYWKPRVEARLQKQAQALAQDHVVTPATSANGGSVLVKTSGQQLLSPRSSRSSSFSSLEDVALQQQGKQGEMQPRRVSSVKSEEQKNVSVVAADNVSTFMLSAMESPRAVSDASISPSESGSESNPDVDDYSIFTTDEIVDGFVVRTETISVHILRPLSEGEKPTMDDVSSLPNIPDERILRSFDNCALTYRFPLDESNDRKKIVGRRDVEVTRLKKHYLRLFLSDAARPPKRKRECSNDAAASPRLKYRRRSLQLWREACWSAPNVYDSSLPSLEEATQLFGYTNKFLRF